MLPSFVLPKLVEFPRVSGYSVATFQPNGSLEYHDGWVWAPWWSDEEMIDVIETISLMDVEYTLSSVPILVDVKKAHGDFRKITLGATITITEPETFYGGEYSHRRVRGLEPLLEFAYEVERSLLQSQVWDMDEWLDVFHLAYSKASGDKMEVATRALEEYIEADHTVTQFGRQGVKIDVHVYY